MPKYDITVNEKRLASKTCHNVFIIPGGRHISIFKQSNFSRLRLYRCWKTSYD